MLSAVTSAGLDFQVPSTPEWLRAEPGSFSHQDDEYDVGVPIYRIAMRLIERHRLPRRCWLLLVYYILTDDAWYLKQIHPFDVRVGPVEAEGGYALTVSVAEVDEFTSLKDWRHIWEHQVEPVRERLLEARGAVASSRRALPSGLAEYMGLYSLVRQDRTADKRIRALDKALRGKGQRLDDGKVPGDKVERALWILQLEGQLKVPSRDRAYEVVSQLDEMLMPE